MLILFQSRHSFIRNYVSYYIRAIEKDEKRTDRQYFCVGCGGAATQTAFFMVEGAL